MVDHHQLPNPKRQATIFSEERAPPITVHEVSVHYFEAGQYKHATLTARRPTYFETLIVSSVHERIGALPRPPIKIASIRNLGRYAYHAARRIADAIRPAYLSPRPVLDTRNIEPNNVAHLLLDLIPHCLKARKTAGQEIDFLFRKVKGRYAEMLALFGIAPHCTTRKVVGESIKLRGTRGLAVYDLADAFDCPALCFFPDTYSDFNFQNGLGFPKIFMARRGSRKLENHNAVEEVTLKYGYKTLYMEDYPVLEQLRIAAQTNHVVALHGAAMSLLVMNKHIESVVELLPPHNYSGLFPVALGARVARYEQILPDFDQTVAHSGWSAISSYKDIPFSVDINLLDKVLGKLG